MQLSKVSKVSKTFRIKRSTQKCKTQVKFNAPVCKPKNKKQFSHKRRKTIIGIGLKENLKKLGQNQLQVKKAKSLPTQQQKQVKRRICRKSLPNELSKATFLIDQEEFYETTRNKIKKLQKFKNKLYQNKIDVLLKTNTKIKHNFINLDTDYDVQFKFKSGVVKRPTSDRYKEGILSDIKGPVNQVETEKRFKEFKGKRKFKESPHWFTVEGTPDTSIIKYKPDRSLQSGYQTSYTPHKDKILEKLLEQESEQEKINLFNSTKTNLLKKIKYLNRMESQKNLPNTPRDLKKSGMSCDKKDYNETGGLFRAISMTSNLLKMNKKFRTTTNSFGTKKTKLFPATNNIKQKTQTNNFFKVNPFKSQKSFKSDKSVTFVANPKSEGIKSIIGSLKSNFKDYQQKKRKIRRRKTKSVGSYKDWVKKYKQNLKQSLRKDISSINQQLKQICY